MAYHAQAHTSSADPPAHIRTRFPLLAKSIPSHTQLLALDEGDPLVLNSSPDSAMGFYVCLPGWENRSLRKGQDVIL